MDINPLYLRISKEGIYMEFFSLLKQNMHVNNISMGSDEVFKI